MKKRLISVFILLFVAVSFVSAANWYEGQNITRFELRGIKNISVSELDDIVYPYRGNQYSDAVLREIEDKLYRVAGVDYVEAEAKRDATNNELVLSFTFHELPMIGSVSFEGNSKVKTTDLIECLTKIREGAFVDLSKGAITDAAKAEIASKYSENGFDSVGVEISIDSNSSTGISNVVFTVKEGVQIRVSDIVFTGNDNLTSSLLKKQLSTKKKSLLEKGYLDKSKIAADCIKLEDFYKSNGYLDVIIGTPEYRDVSSGKNDYREVIVCFPIIEGSLWHFGGFKVSGNQVFTDEEIQAASGNMAIGDVLDFKDVESAISNIANLYYDNGYITTSLPVTQERDDTNMSVVFEMNIVEGTQSVIEEIHFSGLQKTQEKVMRRELEFSEGDVFSKTKLTTSAQNLYNTGLLSDIDYDMYRGNEENGVVLDFQLTEGSTMDIQFGATFGGSATGFPISGFLAWSNNNFRGLGQSLSVSTTVSPSTQSLSLSFGDDWLLNHRWSNAFSFSFSHSLNEGEYQLGTGSQPYDGGTSSNSFPKPFASYEEFSQKGSTAVKDSDLMDYDLISLSLGYNTGYTWIFEAGRLGISGGLSFSLNRALYDESCVPYRKIIQSYGEGWKMSNKLSGSIQWDGRDYVTNTTKGYVVGLSGTTAGGILGGISNYNKLTFSAAGYRKIVEIPVSETKTKPLMLCASTSFTFMLPQFNFFSEDLSFGLNPAYKGATQDEMLYIDGMTIARGHSFLSYQSMLWDNMFELSYQLVEGVIQAEAFVSGTYVKKYLDIATPATDGWYFSAGAGLKLKIQGFPLGFYLVNNSLRLDNDGKFEMLHQGNDEIGNSGFHFVLAISTSLI